VYFASENSKSANYVGMAGSTGIMLLNEVVLGKSHIITKDDPTLTKAPKGYESVLAKGWTEPDPKDDTTMYSKFFL
jgi:poly [ADP-ribose] polymerase